MANAKLQEALACAKRGWAVFPLHNIRGGKCTCNKPQCDSPGKHPRHDWNIITNGVLEASTEEVKIINWWGKWPSANIGIATGSKSGIVAVDIDPRHGGDESWRDLEQKHGKVETVQSLTGGGGCHYLFLCPEDAKIANAASVGGNQGIDIRGEGGYIVGPTSDHLSGKNYQWELLSGPEDITLAPLPEWLLKVCQNGNGAKRASQEPGLPIPQGQRDQTLIKIAGAMRRQGMTQEEMEVALSVVNQSRCQPPLSDDDIKRIAKSASRYEPEPDALDNIENELFPEEEESLTKLTNGENTDISDTSDTSDRTDSSDENDKSYNASRGKIIWKLVDGWLLEHQGERFDLDTICRQLDVKNRADRHHVVKKLSYEVSQKKLEKSDKTYRYINKTYVSIDWLNASSAPPLNIRWPYGIDDDTSFGFDGHVLISPGDVIVIAGVSNTGKTNFCLNLLWENMDAYPCTLMGNEYEAGKFKRRVAKMNWRNPIGDDGKPKFELIERYENWQDIIRPNNINIIDWINLGDAFYQIGKIIEGIKSKLQDGIAVIVVQKADGKALGMGGGFSQHLASLYLAIDFGRLTVVKAKEWYEVDPNGKMYGFKINDGAKFSNIREVAKCRACGGSGRTNRGECQECESRGYVELPKVKEKQASWPQKY